MHHNFMPDICFSSTGRRLQCVREQRTLGVNIKARPTSCAITLISARHSVRYGITPRLTGSDERPSRFTDFTDVGPTSAHNRLQFHCQQRRKNTASFIKFMLLSRVFRSSALLFTNNLSKYRHISRIFIFSSFSDIRSHNYIVF